MVEDNFAGNWNEARRFPRRLCAPVLAAAGLAILMSAGLRAQGPTTGSIAGVVTDPSGAPLPDAKVTASSPALVVPQNTVAGAQGGYRFPSLPPGTYSLSIEAPGFAVLQRENIAITAGFNATVDAQMALAGKCRPLL